MLFNDKKKKSLNQDHQQATAKPSGADAGKWKVPPRPLSTPGKRTLPRTVRAAFSDPLTNREVTSMTHFAVNA